MSWKSVVTIFRISESLFNTFKRPVAVGRKAPVRRPMNFANLAASAPQWGVPMKIMPIVKSTIFLRGSSLLRFAMASAWDGISNS